MRLSACHRLVLGPLTGTWYRAIPQEHWRTRLSARHTITIATRFSAGSPTNPTYQVLYLAQHHQLALFEVRALLAKPEAPIPDPQDTWTILPLTVSLGTVANLTDPAEQKRIGTSAQELTGKWDQYGQSGTAPTQRLGAALFELPGLEGFLVPTAVPGISGTNLVVFPEKLKAQSRIEFRNPNSGRIERLSH
jgi:RES domain-containing protein